MLVILDITSSWTFFFTVKHFELEIVSRGNVIAAPASHALGACVHDAPPKAAPSATGAAVDQEERFLTGSIVVRGKDWKWDNQDREGKGIVRFVCKEAKTAVVKWDEGGVINVYRIGAEGAWDVKLFKPDGASYASFATASSTESIVPRSPI